MNKLTKAQVEALQMIAGRDGYYTPWVIGTRTCEALRKRCLISASSGDRPFTGRFGNDPPLWITPAGRAALTDGAGE